MAERRRFWLLLVAAFLALPATARAASCTPNVAGRALHLAAWQTAGGEGVVRLTFLGHASFLIESPQGITIVTDYNGYIKPAFLPDVVTMNHAHSTHYTDYPEPGIKYVLRGWDTGEGPPHWDLRVGDVRIRNVLTNIRNAGEPGGTEYGGNSIFVFETADLCIAHLSHLHHTLTPEHLADLGQIDVLLAPADGIYTLSQRDMIEVIEQVHPALVIPMHLFGPPALERFLERMNGRYPVRWSPAATVALSRDMLPKSTEMMILPGF